MGLAVIATSAEDRRTEPPSTKKTGLIRVLSRGGSVPRWDLAPLGGGHAVGGTSSIISTTPSTWRSAGVSAPISTPRRRAREDRTWSMLRHFSLDLARLQDVLSQHAQDGFFAKREPQAFHPPDEQSLPVTDSGKLVCQRVLVPAETRPIVSFVDIHGYSPHFLRM